MLHNFLEHTRCNESALAGLDTSRGDESPSRTLPGSPEEAKALVGELLAAPDSGKDALKRLEEIDWAIGMLRLEQYIDAAQSSNNPSGLKAVIRKGYYALRPLFPVSFRKYLQRIALKGWDQLQFPRWPVDFTIEDLMNASCRILIQSQGIRELPFIWFWPDGQSSACIMTHDVEEEAGRQFCAEMMTMERRHGIVSAFEIVPEQRYTVSEDYLQEIRDGGCEVCIHGLNHDGHLFSSQSLFLERAGKINSYAKSWKALGFRSPVLYRNLAWLHELKFAYDMSVPNVGHLDPQRGGCCTVMPYFIGDTLELPLTTIQDYSLFNILQERTIGIWVKQIDLIRKRHGLVSFIVHPDYVNEGWSKAVYDQLLQHLADLRTQGMWIALPREVNAWWRARREMRLVRQGEEWKIVGPDAHRARVAYATVEGDSVVFNVDRDARVASV